MKRANFPARREQRRKEAAERQKIRDARIIDEQLSLIVDRPGESKRERKRIVAAEIARTKENRKGKKGKIESETQSQDKKRKE